MQQHSYSYEVAVRLHKMLDSQNLLPCKFIIAQIHYPQSDFAITLVLEPQLPCEGVFETSEVFGELHRKLNGEFRGDPRFYGINIRVPYRFLGRERLQQHLAELTAQGADNERYRRVRLDRSDYSPTNHH